MTKQERLEFIARCEEYKERFKTDKEAARQFLINAGIYNEDGTLNEHYQGLETLLL